MKRINGEFYVCVDNYGNAVCDVFASPLAVAVHEGELAAQDHFARTISNKLSFYKQRLDWPFLEANGYRIVCARFTEVK